MGTRSIDRTGAARDNHQQPGGGRWHMRMKTNTLTAVFVLGAVTAAAVAAGAIALAAAGQARDAQRRAQLARLFPDAARFSAKEGSPPHIKVYAHEPGSEEPRIVGYGFLTTDIEPLERGYDGPIQILVGMDTSGVLAGIVVGTHHEPYGYFSIDLPDYATQFKAKSIGDRFRPGRDIDAVATATLTVGSATRAVKNSARRIARAFLTPPGASR